MCAAAVRCINFIHLATGWKCTHGISLLSKNGRLQIRFIPHRMGTWLPSLKLTLCSAYLWFLFRMVVHQLKWRLVLVVRLCVGYRNKRQRNDSYARRVNKIEHGCSQKSSGPYHQVKLDVPLSIAPHSNFSWILLFSFPVFCSYSNDLMRDHHFRLMSQKYFLKWRERLGWGFSSSVF